MPMPGPVWRDVYKRQVVGNRSVWAKRALDFLVELIAVGDLRDGADHHLSRQSCADSCLRVGHFVDGVRGEGLRVPCLFADPVGALVGGFERAQKRMLVAAFELHFCSQFHRARLF